MPYYVYIVSNKRNGTLYVGSTSNLIKRIWQHKNKLLRVFTAKYNLNILVYYEIHQQIHTMAQREKRLKEWKRSWKLEIIEEQNPDWKDLYYSIIG